MGFGEIEALHAVDYESHCRALKCEVFERRTNVEYMHRIWFAVQREDFVRDDDHEHCSIATPGLVALDKKIEKRLPLRRIAASVKEPPLLLVVSGRRPTCGLEKRVDLILTQRLAGHGSRRPAGTE